MEIKKIALIGAGNLATQLGLALYTSKIEVSQVFSRTLKAANDLASQVNSVGINDLKQLSLEADLYIISVNDDALEDVLSQIDIENKFIVHTAGSIPVDILQDYSSHYGVFYPFQTFSKNKKVDFKEIPICIEANSEDNLNKLENLANTISEKVVVLNSNQRLMLHIAAVLSCNFVNHLYALSDGLLVENGLSFDLLRNLIQETTVKLDELTPKEAQTGPAARNDQQIVKKHLELLNDKPQLKKIYELMSESIINLHQKK